MDRLIPTSFLQWKVWANAWLPASSKISCSLHTNMEMQIMCCIQQQSKRFRSEIITMLAHWHIVFTPCSVRVWSKKSSSVHSSKSNIRVLNRCPGPRFVHNQRQWVNEKIRRRKYGCLLLIKVLLQWIYSVRSTQHQSYVLYIRTDSIAISESDVCTFASDCICSAVSFSTRLSTATFDGAHANTCRKEV